MRYVMCLFVAAFLLAPVVGCDSHSKTTEKTNPITGTHTVEKESSTDTH